MPDDNAVFTMQLTITASLSAVFCPSSQLWIQV